MIEKEKKLHLFRNNYIIDCLIKILETYKDIEVIKRAVALLNALLRDISIIEVFKDLKGLEIIAQIYIGIDTEEIKGAFYVCFKLLSEIEYDLLHEMQKLGLVERLLDELETVKNPFSQIMILSTLINLSMNDQNNILIRQYGVDIVGKKLLVPENISTFCSNDQDERDTRLKVELLSLVLLRFLYSVEKN